MGKNGGTDWAADAVSSYCLGDVPFAALRVVRVYDILHYSVILYTGCSQAGEVSQRGGDKLP